MTNILRGMIRTSAFLRKEIFEILRQPRLIFSLVLGPFLILLLFGIGYKNEARALRTVFVVEPGSGLEAQIQEYADSLGPQLIFMGVNNDEENAKQLLRQRRVDLVAVAPPNAYETIRNNQQAVFTLYHNEIDPLQADYVRYFGKIYVDEVNRRVLRSITDEGQGTTLSTQEDISAARASATEMREALERGDSAAAREHQRETNRRLDAVEDKLGTSIGVLEGVEETLGQGADQSSTLRESLSAARESANTVGTIEDNQQSYDDQADAATELETELETLDSELAQFQAVDSQVLVSPFSSETQSVASVQPDIAAYFAPSVIVLLLQHLAVTFAALSIVREIQTGTIELFRVSPISAGETLIGKYLSYLIFGGVVALILTLLIIYGLRVPMLGLWQNYALVIFALLFASLGIGFFISMIVETDSQAVQYAMIVLLSSVFFSGFFLSLSALIPAVQTVSWALPATYAIQLLQDIMLRGTTGNPVTLTGLFGIGALFYVISWALLRRKMARD